MFYLKLHVGNMIKKISILVLGLLFLSQSVSFGQEQSKIKISGLIKDQNNQPLPFVNIFLKDSFDGDVSDSTGFFEFVTTLTGDQVFFIEKVLHTWILK